MNDKTIEEDLKEALEAQDVPEQIAEAVVEPAPEPTTDPTPEAVTEPVDKPVDAPPEVTEAVVEPAPSSWTGAVKAEWAKLPESVRAEINKRETDIHQMFTRHDGELRLGREMKEVVTPYMAVIQSEGGTPATAVRDLLNTAYQLRTGTPAQKAALVSEIINTYGVDMQSAAPQGDVDPVVQNLQQQIEKLQQMVNPENLNKQLQDRMENDRIISETTAFAADAKNVHFNEVRPLMAALMGNGQADTLQKAYEMACRAHPTISSTLKAQEETAKQAKLKEEIEAKKKASVSVTGSPGTFVANSTLPQKTLEEDLAEQLQAAMGQI